MAEKKTSDKKLAYIADYDKERTKGIYLKLNKTYDSDVIEWLETKVNKQGYIKDLIRADKNKNQE